MPAALSADPLVTLHGRSTLHTATGRFSGTFVAVAGAHSDLSNYTRQAICHTFRGANGSWPSGERMPPCWRHAECDRALRDIPNMRHSETSCSFTIRDAGCFSRMQPWPSPSVHKVMLQWGGLTFQRAACQRFAPRDGCMCQPCYTECRRSVLCPGTTPSLIRPPETVGADQPGQYAFATTLVYSSEFVRQHGYRHWHDKYIHGLARLALSLRDANSTAPLIVLAANLTGHAVTRRLLLPLIRADLRVQVVHGPYIKPPRRYRRSRFCATYNKLRVWNLTAYGKAFKP